MEEITLTRNYEISNFKLNQKTNKIYKLLESTKENMLEIAHVLAMIKNDNMLNDEFIDIFDYAKKMFGFKKSTVYKMLKCANTFISDNGKETVFITEKDDFSLSQLFEMQSESVEDIKEMLDNGVITFDMPCKEIRNVMKEKKKAEKTEDIEDTEDTEDTKDTEDMEVEVLSVETIDYMMGTVEGILAYPVTDFEKLVSLKSFLNKFDTLPNKL